MKVIKRNYTGEPDKLIMKELAQYCSPPVRISRHPGDYGCGSIRQGL
ncbi:MAG TPA: hypothetical protein VF831_09895 [Anaerolineales bacterium]